MIPVVELLAWVGLATLVFSVVKAVAQAYAL